MSISQPNPNKLSSADAAVPMGHTVFYDGEQVMEASPQGKGMCYLGARLQLQPAGKLDCAATQSRYIYKHNILWDQPHYKCPPSNLHDHTTPDLFDMVPESIWSLNKVLNSRCG